MIGAPISFPRGREIVLGVSAGIAAYKSCELLRRLQDDGFLVTVIPTEASLNFVGKSTWEALSGRPVATSVWENTDSVSHVSLAEKCDLIVVAPATADVIARIAQGRADDLLTTTILASAAPTLVVPAMHPHMWLNPATQENVATLRARGFVVMEPEVGRLTGNDSGIGRFPETASIVARVQEISNTKPILAGKRVIVSTGGKRETIDAVR
ncbi:MAG: flavoprotein [Actinomycetota bacterium]